MALRSNTLRAFALALAAPFACDDPTSEDVVETETSSAEGTDDDATADPDDGRDPEEGSDSGDSSDGEPPTGDDPTPACADATEAIELQYAMAIPELTESGATRYRLYLTSYEADCSTVYLEAPPEQSRVSMMLPADPEPGALDLRELDAFALMQANAPGNPWGVEEFAFLHGVLQLDRVAPGRISGSLCDETVPFTGPFDAIICE